MPKPTLDFGSFSQVQLESMLASAQAEYLVRMTGRVQQGSSAAQSYGFNLMQVDDLVLLINGLTMELGLQTVVTQVQPDFSHSGYGISGNIPPPY